MELLVKDLLPAREGKSAGAGNCAGRPATVRGPIAHRRLGCKSLGIAKQGQ